MDPLGVKKIIKVLEDATGAVIPQTGEVLAKVANELDAAGVFLGEATELTKAARELVDAMPEEIQKFRQPILALLDHFVRVGTRASNAAQQAERTLARADKLLSAIHERGFKVQIPIAE